MNTTRHSSLIFITACVFFFSPIFAYAATLSVSPVSGTYAVGDRVTVRILVSASEPLNAISGMVSFPTSLFTIESVSKSGSVLNFWVTEPSFSAGAGTMSFEGVALSGFSGGTGTVVSATLRAVRAGSGNVTISNAQVLANDGEGTNILNGTTGAAYSVTTPTPVVPPESTPQVPQSSQQEATPPEEEPVEEIIEIDIPQPAPTLDAPSIRDEYRDGVHTLYGTSGYPGAQALITFESEHHERIFLMTRADNEGAFTLSIPKSLRHGTYTVSAVMVRDDLSHSNSSNVLALSLGSLFSDIGREALLLITSLVLVLLYCIVRGYRYMRKNKKLRLFVRREAHEAEERTHEVFDALREDVNTALDRRGVSAGERKRLHALEGDLDAAERTIAKEVRDIEKT